MADTWEPPIGGNMDNAIPLSLNSTWSGSVDYDNRYFSFSGLDPKKIYYFLVTGDQEVDARWYDSNRELRGWAREADNTLEIAYVTIKNASNGFLGAVARKWGSITNFTVTLKEGDPSVSLDLDLDEILIAVGQTHSIGFWATAGSSEIQNYTNIVAKIENESVAKMRGNFIFEGMSPGTTKLTITSKLTGIKDTKTIKVVPVPSFEGLGSTEDPYIVRSAQDLYNVRFNLGATYKQVADISLAAYENWRVIGTMGNGFTGDYYGDGFKITNLTITDVMNYANQYHSLFGFTSNAYLEGIHIENVTISTDNSEDDGDNMGALVGHSFNTALNNCHAKNVSIEGYMRVGGLIGLMEGTFGVRVDYCSAENVNLYAYLTGAGGLIGSGAGSITNSYATGSLAVSYGSAMGGLIGQFFYTYSWPATVINCYTACSMSGGEDTSIGGIAPTTDSKTVTLQNCYYAEGVTNDEIGSGIGLSGSQMTKLSSFRNWDFFTIWDIIEGRSYPFIHLREKAFKCKSAPLPFLYGKLRRI